jgi:glutamyl-tRNA synthetase
MNAQDIRVRFAPSPTGHLHLGSARTALYNWLYARKTGGVFVLRIEDTDAARSTEESYESIIDALEWLGLDWDEGPGREGEFGPYLQSARQVVYHTEAQKLLAGKAAYRCFCSPEELEELRSSSAERGGETKYDRRCRNLPADEVERRVHSRTPHVVRFKLPDGETRFGDIIRGLFTFNNAELDDFVILKSDGRPTYNFAAVADDAMMKISHVIRGDDHITNTPKQVLLYRALGYPLPKFAHLPMILGSDRSRLSKRHGATSVQEYRSLGYLSDGFINYLALLGWAYDDKTEFFTRQSLIDKFSLKKVSKNPAAFDTEKLNHINGEHFKRLESGKKTALIESQLVKAGVLPADFEATEWSGSRGSCAGTAGSSGESHRLAFIINLMGNRLKVAGDAPKLLRYFFKDDFERDAEAHRKHLNGPRVAELLERLARLLESIEPFTRDEIEAQVRSLAEEAEVTAGDLIHPCRVALTGSSVSPDIFSVIQLVGKKKCIERLSSTADHVRSV